ncbi:MAG: serine protease [Firmicutes bacterium]|nr:serine protease [Bacillota bacterium]
MKIKAILTVLLLLIISLNFFGCNDKNHPPICCTTPPPPSISQTISTVKYGVVEVAIAGSRGSGVIIDKVDGSLKILTNLHIIRSFNTTPSNVQIRFYTSSNFVYAPVIGYALNYDLAVISAPYIPSNYHIFEFNYEIYQTQKVFALGYLVSLGTNTPIGTFTVLDGLISATETNFLALNRNFYAISSTAPIRGGISGGALIDIYGRLVGIPSWGYIHNGVVMPFGISYNIPALIASAIFDRVIISDQQMAHLNLGFFINNDGRVHLILTNFSNVYIRQYVNGFYKYNQGVRTRIEKVNGYQIESMSMLLAQIIRTLNNIRFN